MSIIDLPTAKQVLNIGSNDGTHDALLTRFLNGITTAAENYKHEVIAKREIVERVSLCGARRFRLWSLPVIPPLVSLVSLDGTVTWDVSAGTLDVVPETGLVEVITGQRPSGRFKVTYFAGYETPPEHYVQGACVMLQHLWDTQRGAGQAKWVAGAMGPDELRPRAVGGSFTVPNRAKEWFGPPVPVVG